MNILDFFCEEKECDKKYQKLKRKYFSELNETQYTCEECDYGQIQKKYLKELYYSMKNTTKKDK